MEREEAGHRIWGRWTRIKETDPVAATMGLRPSPSYPSRVRLSLVVLLASSGCAMLMPPVRPMVQVEADLPGRARCLIVFLPGVGDVAADFEGNGFVDAVRKRRLSVDVVSAQATLSYYALGTVVQRLEADVMGPAREKRYRQTWLIGLSMGGRGALLYAHDYPREVTGVLALAPFLGMPPLTKKIRDAGGLAAWNAPRQLPVTDEDTTMRELWRWLQAVTAKKEPGPKLYLGWGVDDELLGESNEVLAEALPEHRRFPVTGGHKWAAWKKALEFFLDDSDFARGCGR